MKKSEKKNLKLDSFSHLRYKPKDIDLSKFKPPINLRQNKSLQNISQNKINKLIQSQSDVIFNQPQTSIKYKNTQPNFPTSYYPQPKISYEQSIQQKLMKNRVQNPQYYSYYKSNKTNEDQSYKQYYQNTQPIGQVKPIFVTFQNNKMVKPVKSYQTDLIKYSGKQCQRYQNFKPTAIPYQNNKIQFNNIKVYKEVINNPIINQTQHLHGRTIQNTPTTDLIGKQIYIRRKL